MSLFRQKWYLFWVFLPIMAYYLSLSTGIGFIFAFPLFLFLAQFIALRQHPSTQHSERWWWLLPITILFFVVAINLTRIIREEVLDGKLPSVPVTMACYIFSFYISQVCAEFLLPSIFHTWQTGYWAKGNGIAAIVWIGIFQILYYLTDRPYELLDSFWYYCGNLIPSLFANAITGCYLHLGTED